MRLTAAGANHLLRRWRYSMWIGGSRCEGRKRYAGSGSVAVIEWFEKCAGSWKASRMSS